MKSKFLFVMGIIYVIIGVFSLIGLFSYVDTWSVLNVIFYLLGGILAIMFWQKQENAKYCFIVGLCSLVIAIIYAVSLAIVGTAGTMLVAGINSTAGLAVGIFTAVIAFVMLIFPILYVVAARKFMKK